MPHAWTIVIPSRSKSRISCSGAAAPPTIIRSPGRSGHVPFAAASSASRIAIQIVGTPAALVTRSADISSSRLGGSRCGPHSTRRAPTIAAAYGSPHALTWNIGTTGSSVSARDSPSESGRAATSVCSTVERCV